MFQPLPPSALEAECALEGMLHEYRSGSNKDEFHQFLIQEYFYGRRETASVILKYIKQISSDVSFLNIDVLSHLQSEEKYLKKLAVKFVKVFWQFYEYDEVVVFLIHKYKCCFRLLRRNSKYREFYKKRLSAVKSNKKVKNKTTKHAKIASNLDISRILGKSPTNEELLEELKLQYSNCDLNERIIFNYFINKLTGCVCGVTAAGNDELDPLIVMNMHGLTEVTLFKELSCYCRNLP